MTQCSRCLATVTDDRQTCPRCGKITNPEGADPPIQDASRATTTIANLRDENAILRSSIETAERDQRRAEEAAAELRESLTALSAEHRMVMDEIAVLKAMVIELDRKSRHLRDRLDALGVPTFRPFEARQVSLFPERDRNNS
ncbi:MAG: hypothetical protein AB7V46_07345, partial [Thermomicrobiales bacterium]